MKKLSKIFKIALVGFIALNLFGCDTSDDSSQPINRPSVVDAIFFSENFSLLEEALIKAGLTDVLRGPGPFTVFAPNNEAFEKYLKEKETTLETIDKENLADILRHHVASGRFISTDIKNDQKIGTLNGEITPKLITNGITLTDETGGVSKIFQPDVFASNGVVHAIDKLLIPEEKPDLKTIAGLIADDPNFSMLKKALDDTSLTSIFDGDIAYTVFAPTNDAFTELLTELGVTYEEINVDVLGNILKSHAVIGKVASSALKDNESINALIGSLKVNLNPNKLTDANGRESNITEVNSEASNGLIHKIDKVVLPLISKEYALAEKDASGISGKATFTLDVKTNGTIVTLKMENTPEGGMHPAHIHFGSVADNGDIAIDLKIVEGGAEKGTSVTNITKTNNGDVIIFDDLIDFNGHINVHLSAEEIEKIVAQGNIRSNVN